MSEKIIDTAAQTAAPKTAKKKPAAPKKVADTGGFCVYLGPTMMGVIQRGTIYRGGRKEVLDSLAPVIEQHPLIASLVVSDETLPADRIKVKTPGNLLYVTYHKLAQGMKYGGQFNEPRRICLSAGYQRQHPCRGGVRRPLRGRSGSCSGGG